MPSPLLASAFGMLFLLLYAGVIGFFVFLVWRFVDAVTRMSRSMEQLVELYRNKPAA
jgi:hypothetical protein